MKFDKRFLKGVETLGQGQVDPHRQLATDGHAITVVVATEPSGEPPFLLDKAEAKVLLKAEEGYEIPHRPGTVVTDEMWQNLLTKYEGMPEIRFVVDWDLLGKAVKALAAEKKGRPQVVCDIYRRPEACYYRLFLRGDSAALAYVAGVVHQPVANEEQSE